MRWVRYDRGDDTYAAGKQRERMSETTQKNGMTLCVGWGIETNLERGKLVALRFRVRDGNHEAVWSSATGPGKWSRQRPWPASSHPLIETGREVRQDRNQSHAQLNETEVVFSPLWIIPKSCLVIPAILENFLIIFILDLINYIAGV